MLMIDLSLGGRSIFMGRRLNVKRLRQVTMLASAGVLIACFQNCAQQSNEMCVKGTCPGDKTTTTPSTDSQNPNFGGTGGGSSGGSSGGGDSDHPSFGGNLDGGGGSSGGSTTTNSNGMSFYKDLPSTIRVAEGATFSLDVYVTGGSGTYTYTWFRNRQEVTNISGNVVNFFGDIADRYYKEGTYYVEVRDSAHGLVKSATTTVSIMEPTTSCAAGTYVIGDGQDRYGMQDVNALFNTPRGAYWVTSSHPNLSYLMGNAGYWGLRTLSFPNTRYTGTIGLGCGTYLPSWTKSRPLVDANSGAGHWQGQITAECHGNKWKLVGNSCSWVDDTPDPSYY